MPIFEKPPVESLNLFKDRWTPLYLEHGRLEVDDSSVKWISSQGLVCNLPIASLTVLLLGPGVSVTHAAIKACADSNTLVAWVGEESTRFYSYGIAPTQTNDRLKRQVAAWSNKKMRLEIARNMYRMRFPDIEIENATLVEMRGMEGARVRKCYTEMGEKYGVTWKGRKYNRDNWDVCDEINKAITSTSQSLYALCHSVIYMMGYLPQLGFIHETGYLPLVYDIADLYKSEISIPVSFEAVSRFNGDREETRILFKEKVEKARLIDRMPEDLENVFKI